MYIHIYGTAVAGSERDRLSLETGLSRSYKSGLFRVRPAFINKFQRLDNKNVKHLKAHSARTRCIS